ncbi:MAG TPA: hypothetical protein P5211_01510 [Anaerolineae bacterium]|nr:hypothetical protein [Anaerolineae bacterium]
MNAKNVRKPLFVGAIALTLLVAFSLISRPAMPANASTVFNLQAPSFVSTTNAEAGSIASVIGDEAGISAYYQASAPIVFTSNFKAVFRTIEAETDDYIIGSVAVENYPESEDVHVYVNTNGWVLAYYLKANPVGKIFDWKSYTGTSIDTKLEKTLIRVASFAEVTYTGATFYDFRYPNANRLMLIGETYDNNFWC